MFCTDEEQLTCNSEKIGCEGCYYNNDKNLFKKLTKLKKISQNQKELIEYLRRSCNRKEKN